MATRSTVKFYEGDQEEPILSVYHHWDGYISGVDHDLAKWLNSKKVINGIADQTMEEGYANGIRCLAAQYVAENKKKIGGFYMTTPDNNEQYNYKVRFLDGKFIIEVENFKGTPDELLNFK